VTVEVFMEQYQLIILVVWLVVMVIGDWLLFRKAGRPGLLSLIPVVNLLVEYSICWSGFVGVLYFALLTAASYFSQSDMVPLAGILGLLAMVMHWIESQKLARSFDKGFLYGLFLFFFDRFARVILGLSSATYKGKH